MMPFLELPDNFKIWSNQQSIHAKIDPVIRTWLLDPDSLTQRIIQHCNNSNRQQSSFRVEVLNEADGIPTKSEALRLNIQTGKKAYLREVLLYCENTPVVYAKTIIPQTTLTGKQKELASLGNKPLGAYLFSQPNLLRDEIEVSPLTYQQQQIWARRSVFYLDRKPLLVYEVFLPKLLHALLMQRKGK